jgi:carbonic anhydrase/acetyltransferase-like protein (isoleucine patch superfamily)
MMKTRLAIATICLLCTIGATVLISEAATIFAGAIVGIDQVQRTITFQTREGRTWTIPVTDSNILTQQQVAMGDRVRIEVEVSESDLSQRITKITKTREGQEFEPTKSLGP